MRRMMSVAIVSIMLTLISWVPYHHFARPTMGVRKARTMCRVFALRFAWILMYLHVNVDIQDRSTHV